MQIAEMTDRFVGMLREPGALPSEAAKVIGDECGLEAHTILVIVHGEMARRSAERQRTTIVEGVVRRSVLDLVPGDRVDLECDTIADPERVAANGDGEASEHPEFEFETEVVLELCRESDDVIRIDFESGFSCGFPVEHLVDVDGEQREPATLNRNFWTNEGRPDQVI